MREIVINLESDYDAIGDFLDDKKIERIMIVHRGTYENLFIKEYVVNSICAASKTIVHFSDYETNPTYDSVQKGVNVCNENNIQCIIAVGGGSTIDVAKGIKYYSNNRNDICQIAIPTTAGSGSEATHFAVIYRNQVKESLADKSLLPDISVLDSNNIGNLPKYQRLSTGLDAFCHCVESMWAKGATDESMSYASEALGRIIINYDGYVKGDKECSKEMLIAANLAGKAINISKTTAAHAMSYKLSALLHISHGHAAALCLEQVWKMMLKRGKNESVVEVLSSIDAANDISTLEWLTNTLNINGLRIVDSSVNADVIDELVKNVNVERLSNHPMDITQIQLTEMYKAILG